MRCLFPISPLPSAFRIGIWNQILANGGRVLLVEGDLAAHAEIYDQLCAEAQQLGNYPVDLLACVPPSLVLHDEETPSVPGRQLVEKGKAVWDASSVDVRAHFPTDRNALRIVQYDSCRGLEGWTVINYGFDDFWNYKLKQWLFLTAGNG